MKYTPEQFMDFYNGRKQEFIKDENNVVECSDSECGTYCLTRNYTYKLSNIIATIKDEVESKIESNNNYHHILIENSMFSVEYCCPSRTNTYSPVKLSCKISVSVSEQLSLF